MEYSRALQPHYSARSKPRRQRREEKKNETLHTTPIPLVACDHGGSRTDVIPAHLNRFLRLRLEVGRIYHHHIVSAEHADPVKNLRPGGGNRSCILDTPRTISEKVTVDRQQNIYLTPLRASRGGAQQQKQNAGGVCGLMQPTTKMR